MRQREIRDVKSKTKRGTSLFQRASVAILALLRLTELLASTSRQNPKIKEQTVKLLYGKVDETNEAKDTEDYLKRKSRLSAVSKGRDLPYTWSMSVAGLLV